MMDQHNNILGFLTQLVVNPLTLVLTLGNVFTVSGQTQFWSPVHERGFGSRRGRCRACKR